MHPYFLSLSRSPYPTPATLPPFVLLHPPPSPFPPSSVPAGPNMPHTFERTVHHIPQPDDMHPKDYVRPPSLLSTTSGETFQDDSGIKIGPGLVKGVRAAYMNAELRREAEAFTAPRDPPHRPTPLSTYRSSHDVANAFNASDENIGRLPALTEEERTKEMETHLRMNPSSTGLTDQQRAKEPHGWYGKHSGFTSPYPGDYQAGVDGPWRAESEAQFEQE